MDKQKIKASILRKIESELDIWLDKEPTITDPMEYEQTLFGSTLAIGRAILKHSRGELPRDRNAKKKS